MKNFIRAVLSENGVPSSKRVGYFILLLAFLAELCYSALTTKEPSATLRDQLYYMLVTATGVIFGSNVLNTIAKIKTVQSDNNAATGNASPPAATVVEENK